jgi:hypothetical protein
MLPHPVDFSASRADGGPAPAKRLRFLGDHMATYVIGVVAATLLLTSVAMHVQGVLFAGYSRRLPGRGTGDNPVSASARHVAAMDQLLLDDAPADGARRVPLLKRVIGRKDCDTVASASMQTSGVWSVACGSGSRYRVEYKRGGALLMITETAERRTQSPVAAPSQSQRRR